MKKKKGMAFAAACVVGHGRSPAAKEPQQRCLLTADSCLPGPGWRLHLGPAWGADWGAGPC